MSLLANSRDACRVLAEFSNILPALGIRMDGKVMPATECV